MEVDREVSGVFKYTWGLPELHVCVEKKRGTFLWDLCMSEYMWVFGGM